MEFRYRKPGDFNIIDWVPDHHSRLSKKGSPQRLPNEDIEGFPWCDLPPGSLTQSGLRVVHGSLERMRHIMGQEYPTFDLMHRPTELLQAERTAFYLRERPLGVTVTHTFKREELSWFGMDEEVAKLCGELDVVYVTERLRERGYGSLLFSLALLRLMQQNPELIYTHITDKTGRLAGLHTKHGFVHTRKSPIYTDAEEYQRTFAGKEDKDAFKQELQQKIQNAIL